MLAFTILYSLFSCLIINLVCTLGINNFFKLNYLGLIIIFLIIILIIVYYFIFKKYFN